MNNCQPCSTISYGNTGAGKSALQRVAKTGFLVPLYDSNGAKNKYDPEDAFDQAFLDDRINDPDPTKRWYPVGNIKSVTSEKGERVAKEYEDGTIVNVREGIRSFSAIVPNMTPTFLKKLEAWGCREFGLYLGDDCNQLIGDSDGTYVYPPRVDENSWNPTYTFPTDTAPVEILLSFNFHTSMRDSNLVIVTGIDADLNGAKGLIDVYAKYTNITTSGFEVELYTEYGVGLDNVKCEGLLLNDFKDNTLLVPARAFNITDTAVITLTSADESAANAKVDGGKYAIVFALAQTSADKIALYPKKNGFDFSAVTKNPVTIP